MRAFRYQLLIKCIAKSTVKHDKNHDVVVMTKINSTFNGNNLIFIAPRLI